MLVVIQVSTSGHEKICNACLSNRLFFGGGVAMARSVASTGASGAAAPSGAVQGSGKPGRKMKVKKETIEFLRQKKNLNCRAK